MRMILKLAWEGSIAVAVSMTMLSASVAGAYNLNREPPMPASQARGVKSVLGVGLVSAGLGIAYTVAAGTAAITAAAVVIPVVLVVAGGYALYSAYTQPKDEPIVRDAAVDEETREFWLGVGDEDVRRLRCFTFPEDCTDGTASEAGMVGNNSARNSPTQASTSSPPSAASGGPGVGVER